MDVRDIMTSDVGFCRPETNLASAAASMWEHNCGILPVVNQDMQVTGTITDRDICIALATRNRLASDMTVGEVSARRVFACRPDESVRTAIAIMRDHKVRRVPVTNHDGTLAGMLSIDDIILHARDKKSARNQAITYEDVIEAQKVLMAPPITVATRPVTETPVREDQPVFAHGSDFDFEE